MDLARTCAKETCVDLLKQSQRSFVHPPRKLRREVDTGAAAGAPEVLRPRSHI